MSDYIKREDAIKHFKAKADHYRKRLARIEAQGDAIGYDPTEQINGFKDEIAIYEDVVKEIKDIPSAEKQGEWITEEIDSIYGKKIRLECSECGDRFDVSEMAFPYERFCRYCGARMKGADDETD